MPPTFRAWVFPACSAPGHQLPAWPGPLACAQHALYQLLLVLLPVALGCLVLSLPVLAAETRFVSNIVERDTFARVMTKGRTAQRFRTGPLQDGDGGGFLLKSITLPISSAYSSPIPVVNIRAHIVAPWGGRPGAVLYTLSNPSPMDLPVYPGFTQWRNFTFTAPADAVLAPDTAYWVEVWTSAPGSYFNLGITRSSSQTSSPGWKIVKNHRHKGNMAANIWKRMSHIQAMDIRAEAFQSAPVARGVSFTSTPASGGYVTGNDIEITVKFSEAVDVAGTPTFTFELGQADRVASYTSGTGTSDLVFQYTVTATDIDYHGVSIPNSEFALALPTGASITKHGSTETAVLNSISYVAPALALKVNAPVQVLQEPSRAFRFLTKPGAAGDTFGLGETIRVRVAFDEAVTVTPGSSGQVPQLELDIRPSSGGPRLASYVRGTGTRWLDFDYVVQSGDYEPHGVAISANSVRLNGAQINEEGGAVALLSHPALQRSMSRRVDASLAPRPPFLSDLKLDPGTLDPPFDPDVAQYNVKVGPDDEATTITITPDVGVNTSILPVDSDAEKDGHQVAIPVGSTSITVSTSRSSAPNLANVDYVVMVTRPSASVPTAAPAQVTAVEDTAYSFSERDFNFVSVDDSTLASVKIVSLPSKGTLLSGGTAMTNNQVVSTTDIPDLTYTPAANANGNDYDSFSFKVNDGSNESTSEYTMTIHVTPVDDAPTGVPVISGTAKLGHTLTASTDSIADVDGLANAVYEYKWYRVDDEETQSDIPDATASTFTPLKDELAHKVMVVVTFTDDDGTEHSLVSAAYPSDEMIVEDGGICGRTRQVREGILAMLPAGTTCLEVTSAQLASLTGDLDLHRTGIKELQVGDFAGLTRIKELFLNNNDLITLPVGIFSDLGQVTFMRLDNNEIMDLLPGVFQGLGRVKTLKIHYNKFTTHRVGVFTGLDRLKNLYAYNTKYLSFPVGAFDGLPKLERLFLVRTMLTTLPPQVFAGLDSLKLLNIEAPLTSLPDGVFDGLGKLEALYITGRMTELPPGIFSGLGSLKHLVVKSYLPDSRSVVLPQGVFSDLTSLRILDLIDNRFTTLPDGIFSPDLSRLEYLFLDGNRFRTIPDNLFESLVGAKQITLKRNPGMPFESPAVAAVDGDGTVSVLGGAIVLDGNGSGGPWGSNVTYKWTLTDAPEDTLVEFDDDRSATPTVTIPALPDGTELTFTLKVKGRTVAEKMGTVPGTDTVTVTVSETSTNVPRSVNGSPRLLSIARADPPTSPTNKDSLVWRLEFSEDVRNVDAGDFLVAGTTAEITAVTPVKGSPAFDVTVSGGDLAQLDATVTLSLSSEQDISGSRGVALADLTPRDGNVNTYVVDNTPPTVTIGGVPSPTDPFTATFTFSEDVEGFALGDVSVEGGGASAFNPVSPSVYTVLVTPRSGSSSLVTVPADVVRDRAGNPNLASAAQVTSVAIQPAPGEDGRWSPGEAVTVAVGFSRPVSVQTEHGTPSVSVEVGETRQALFSGGSGTSSLSFSYTLVDGDAETSSVQVPANALQLNGGAIEGSSGLAALLAHADTSRSETPSESPADPIQPDSEPPVIAIEDATVREAPGALLEFPVSLDSPSTALVTVDWTTHDVTAKAGHDYLGGSGTVQFDPGESSKTIRIEVLDDAHDERKELMVIILSNPQGAKMPDRYAVGSILNSDLMPQAWLGRFGRTVGEQVVEAVQGRIRSVPEPGSRVTVLGHSLVGPGPDLDALEQVQAKLELARLRSWLTGETDEPEPLLESSSVTLPELLAGSSFSLGARGGAGAGVLSVWGQGAVSSFDGLDGDLSLQGDVTSALVGADWSRARWSGGLLLSHSRGDGAYQDTVDRGDVSSTLTGIYPYGRYDVNERVTVWGTFGYGAGELVLTPEGDTRLETDMDLVMAAAGLRGVLLEAQQQVRPEIALRTDALGVRTSSDSVEGASGNLAASTAQVSRVRVGLEGSWKGVELGTGTVEPRMDLGLRHDAGDAETGFGLDVGAGVAWSDPRTGFQAGASVRGLLAHEAAGFRERGLQATVGWDPRADSHRGPSLTLSHAVGSAADGGVDALLGRTTMAGLTDTDSGDDLGHRHFQVTMGYGVGALGDLFTLIPEAGFEISPDARDYTVGFQLVRDPRPGELGSVALGLEAGWRESLKQPGAAFVPSPEYRLGIHLGVVW